MKTTDLDKIRTGSPYTWGTVLHIFNIDCYTIVEYSYKIEEPIRYAAYIGNKDINRHAESLDEALILAIAHRHLEVNRARWATDFAMLLLTHNEPDLKTES